MVLPAGGDSRSLRSRPQDEPVEMQPILRSGQGYVT